VARCRGRTSPRDAADPRRVCGPPVSLGGVQEYVESEKGRLKEADAVDKTVERARLRARRLKRKLRERGERAEHEAAGGVQLAVPDRDGDEDDEDDGGSGAESADDMSADEGGYAAPSDSDDEDEDAGTRHKGCVNKALTPTSRGSPGLTRILRSFAAAQLTAASAWRRRPRSSTARSGPSSPRSTPRRSRCSCWAVHKPRLAGRCKARRQRRCPFVQLALWSPARGRAGRTYCTAAGGPLDRFAARTCGDGDGVRVYSRSMQATAREQIRLRTVQV